MVGTNVSHTSLVCTADELTDVLAVIAVSSDEQWQAQLERELDRTIDPASGNAVTLVVRTTKHGNNGTVERVQGH